MNDAVAAGSITRADRFNTGPGRRRRRAVAMTHTGKAESPTVHGRLPVIFGMRRHP